MARKTIIAGNWKMNLLPAEAFDLIEALKAGLAYKPNVEMVVFPQTALLSWMGEALADSTISLGAQTSSMFTQGAHTGDVSPVLLRSLTCRYALSGHSERRQDHGESDAQVASQAKAQIAAGLKSIVCVGETLEEREAGAHIDKIKGQVQEVYAQVPSELWGDIVLAYEPIWAIGTGKTASPEQAEEIHQMIRALLVELAGGAVAQMTPILYGGSAKAANASSLLSQPNIDGLLVGGASLVAEEFLNIYKAS